MDDEPNKERVVAQWSISLDVECPHCWQTFDIIKHDYEFWQGFREPLSPATAYEATCPKCLKEFPCDFQY